MEDIKYELTAETPSVVEEKDSTVVTTAIALLSISATMAVGYFVVDAGRKLVVRARARFAKNEIPEGTEVL